MDDMEKRSIVVRKRSLQAEAEIKVRVKHQAAKALERARRAVVEAKTRAEHQAAKALELAARSETKAKEREERQAARALERARQAEVEVLTRAKLQSVVVLRLDRQAQERKDKRVAEAAIRREWPAKQQALKDKYLGRVVTYLIQDLNSLAVKIGITRNIDQRLDGLQLGCPSELVVCAVFNADIEGKLHTMFASNRIRREWFIPRWEMVQYANEHAEDNRCQVVVPSAAQVEAFQGKKVAQ